MSYEKLKSKLRDKLSMKNNNIMKIKESMKKLS